MDDILAGQLMTENVVTVEPGTDIETAAERLLSERIGSLVVVDNHDSLVGILTSTDFVRVVANNDPADSTTVEDHMSREVVTVDAKDDIRTAADRLITYNIHRLPVVDDDEGVIGVLSTTDLTAYVSNVDVPDM